ncbi:unnamed protein product [marine sediment metagenome]|uniref:Uncharacterized protein n=1 Tax=marine sediment metagenome TaxID=412755 RepID=X1C2K5_9ZZZZ
MARIAEEEVKRIKKAIANLIYNDKDKLTFVDGKPSPTKISELLKAEYSLDVTRQTVAIYLKEGVGEYRQSLLLEDNDKIRQIKVAMKVQKSIWDDNSSKPADRTKAASVWRQLQKQLIDYEMMLNDAEIRKREVLKPKYLIEIKPISILIVCPKCGHEWYNMEDEEEKKKDIRKPLFKKDSEEQKTIYDNDKDGYENETDDKKD